MQKPLSHSLLLLFLYLTVGSAIGAFVVAKYFPRVEVREIIRDLPQPDIYPCPDPGKGWNMYRSLDHRKLGRFVFGVIVGVGILLALIPLLAWLLPL